MELKFRKQNTRTKPLHKISGGEHNKNNSSPISPEMSGRILTYDKYKHHTIIDPSYIVL